MALVLQHYSLSIFTIVTLFYALLNLNPSSCFNPKLFNVSQPQVQAVSGWAPAGATWYGSPDGSGTDGGACGYGNAVGSRPFSKMVSAGGPSLYKSGQGCGACYQVKCTANPACSGNPVTVVIIDECPGCTSAAIHFDLSGTAFGGLAKPGQQGQLRNAGKLQVQYQRVNCNYPGAKIAFIVDKGSNPNYFATLVEFENGAGDLSKVELQQNTGAWLPMQGVSGATWKLNSGSPLRPPFSIRLTASNAKSLVAQNAIPVGWKAGQTYRSVVNF